MITAKGANDLYKEFGVNWDKTKAPSNESFSLFTDTFHDPEQKEYLTGELVLKNKQTIHYMADTLVADVFELMVNIDVLKSKYVEIFGEE